MPENNLASEWPWWPCVHGAAKQQQDIGARIAGEERSLSARVPPSEESQRQGREQGRLDEEPDEGVGAHELAKQAVEGERRRENQRDPGRCAGRDGE